MGGVSLTAQFIHHQAAGKDILITPHAHQDEAGRKRREVKRWREREREGGKERQKREGEKETEREMMVCVCEEE